jgi:hypothetical protein
MKLLEFFDKFPDESSCEVHLRNVREHAGIKCTTCGCTKQYWNKGKKSWTCSQCGHETTLTSGTVMHASNLPLLYWYKAIHLLTSTKKSFSASEMQRQLGHKRYQPIWEMMHKLRNVMGKRDDRYTLGGCIELDEGFFTTEIPADKKEEELKAGAGSQRKTKVLVMAESTPEDSPKNPKKPNKVKYIKMVVIPDLSAATIDKEAKKSIEPESTVTTDASKSHTHFKDEFAAHNSQVIEPKDIAKVLPWVHLAIANAKMLITDMHHGIKTEFLQEYLNEFCYKFNRRFFGDRVFDRLIIASVEEQSDFKHRMYNQGKCG